MIRGTGREEGTNQMGFSRAGDGQAESVVGCGLNFGYNATNERIRKK